MHMYGQVAAGVKLSFVVQLQVNRYTPLQGVLPVVVIPIEYSLYLATGTPRGLK